MSSDSMTESSELPGNILPGFQYCDLSQTPFLSCQRSETLNFTLTFDIKNEFCKTEKSAKLSFVKHKTSMRASSMTHSVNVEGNKI